MFRHFLMNARYFHTWSNTDILILIFLSIHICINMYICKYVWYWLCLDMVQSPCTFDQGCLGVSPGFLGSLWGQPGSQAEFLLKFVLDHTRLKPWSFRGRHIHICMDILIYVYIGNISKYIHTCIVSIQGFCCRRFSSAWLFLGIAAPRIYYTFILALSRLVPGGSMGMCLPISFCDQARRLAPARCPPAGRRASGRYPPDRPPSAEK